MAAILWLVMQLYLLAVRVDLDYQNDWLTHLPVAMRHLAIVFAHYLYGG